MTHPNNYPKLHNAAWPGVVGKARRAPSRYRTGHDARNDDEGRGGRASVRRRDLFLFPSRDIDSGDDDLMRLADKVRSRGLVIGSVVAPVWPGPAGARRWATKPSARNSSSSPKGCGIARATA